MKSTRPEEPRDRRGRFVIRAIRPDDRANILAGFSALEPKTIYARFFGHRKALGEDEVWRLTHPDGVREAVLVATVGSSGGETIVGLAHYNGGPESAEIAFIVEEDFQGRGIAGLLLQCLVQVARKNGIARFEAHVLPTNAPMLSVLRRSGLPVEEREDDGIVTVTLTLGSGGRTERDTASAAPR